MIQPPSIQRVFDDFWSDDPAFISPPDAPPDDANEETKKQHARAIEDHLRKFERARETGNWDEIKNPGGEPTVFQMRPIKGHVLRALIPKVSRGDLDYRAQASAIAFRACIVKIENPSVDLKKPVRDPEYGDLAPESVTDYLDGIDPSIVTELGLRCLERGTQGLPPKS